MASRRFSSRPLCVLFAMAVSVAGSASAQAPERIAEIRVHGNHTTPDAEILALSGLAAGGGASDAELRAAERKLRETRRFEAVEVRRRYLSISDPSQILVMILVDEHPAVSERDLTPGALKKLWAAAMWLPILHHTDGYGFTYGARVSLRNALGGRSRLSVPLSWGGERRAALEAERSFEGPMSHLRGSVAVSRQMNPHFDAADLRRGARVEADRVFTPSLRAGAGARIATVTFGRDYQARHAAAGVHATFDTRLDPSFPRNAVYAQLGWERLFPGTPDGGRGDAGGWNAAVPGGVGRWNAEARLYAGAGGAAVLALRARVLRAGGPLPPPEQALLGGSDSLRGYRVGHRAGDSLAAASVEVRLPLDSPLSAGRFGLRAFVDAGTVWQSGGRLTRQRFERGMGGGIYLGAGPFHANFDLAWPEHGKPRGHFGLGLGF